MQNRSPPGVPDAAFGGFWIFSGEADHGIRLKIGGLLICDTALQANHNVKNINVSSPVGLLNSQSSCSAQLLQLSRFLFNKVKLGRLSFLMRLVLREFAVD